MIRPPSCDFWQVGIAPFPLESLLDSSRLPHDLTREIVWLPDPGEWRYLADPFGLQRNGSTHVFVEAYDYRRKHAVIEHHELGPDLSWRGKCTALAGPHHLSYPFVVEHEGEVFMIPESSRAGEIALFRAQRFPDQWVRETALLAGVPGAEASVISHDGRWWMFFTLVGPDRRDQRELHLAYADRLTGPWQLHHGNPVLTDLRGARPGGTPFVDKTGALILPVQDCSRTYGGGMRFLKFNELTPAGVVAHHLPSRVEGERFSSTHVEGCHTLSACGPLTLLDTKRTVRTWARHKVNLQRHFRQLFGRD